MEPGGRHVSGTLIAVHMRDVDCQGHGHNASEEDPQYEIKGNRTHHVPMHKGSALR